MRKHGENNNKTIYQELSRNKEEIIKIIIVTLRDNEMGGVVVGREVIDHIGETITNSTPIAF